MVHDRNAQHDKPERTEEQKKADRLRARRKMMDLIARRDHSEKELRKKLRERFAPEDIDAALAYGKENGWVPDDAESQGKLAGRMAEWLHQKKKGIHAINHSLKEKGLPPVSVDPERELEKARALLENKFPNHDLSDRALQGKAGRFLASRGFEMSVVRDVIFQRKKNPSRD